MKIEIIFEKRKEHRDIDLRSIDYTLCKVNAKVRCLLPIQFKRFKEDENNEYMWKCYIYPISLGKQVIQIFTNYAVDYLQYISIEKKGFEKTKNGMFKYVIYTKWRTFIK